MRLLCFAAIPLAALLPAQAQTTNFPNEAIVFEQFETHYRMHADGTGERSVHLRVRVQSEAAARQFGVLSFAYASASETPTISYVRVLKTDGKVVETPRGDAIEVSAAVTREAPLYSDLKEKQVPVRSLAAGDTLEYEVRTDINKAEAPGQFWGADHFVPPGTVIALSERLVLEFPKDKFVQVWSPNHKPAISERDGTQTYTWNVAQLTPAAKADGGGHQPRPIKDPDEDADGRKLPSVAWTTFHNWAEVGDWYRRLSLARAQPTEAISARANEITKGIDEPEAQVRAIYRFVSGSTRYVGIDMGAGRYQPHAATEVLANQYGDCKDKDTLLEALLRSKGFKTAPALIGVGIVPVAEVPTPAVFNHVITTVEMPHQQTRRVWLDSTAEVAPYGLLTAAIRDQQALVVPAAGPAALESTPAIAPYPFTANFEAQGTLDPEGKISAHIGATYRTDDEVFVRELARSAPADWDKASQYVSSTSGFGGATSNTRFTHTNDDAAPVGITYDYSRHPYGDWDNLRIVPLFPALEFGLLDADDPAPSNDIELGAPRTLLATSRIKLPDGFHTDLPDAIHVRTSFATFDKTYRFENGEVIAERRVVVLQKKVPKSDWKSYQAFTKNISLDSKSWIQLIRPIKKTEAAISTAEVNSKAFNQANLLIAAWDTLGWVLYREGKLSDAQPYLLAAWRNCLLPEVGEHLAELYEAEGRKQEALELYALSQGASEGQATEQMRSSIKEGVTRLVAGGLKRPATNAVQVLQASRTYKVAKPDGVNGWGTFRLQITSSGVAGAQQISGEQKLAGLTTPLAALKFPELVPSQSKAHLLRSGVVSCSGESCELVLVPNSTLRTELTE